MHFQWKFKSRYPKKNKQKKTPDILISKSNQDTNQVFIIYMISSIAHFVVFSDKTSFLMILKMWRTHSRKNISKNFTSSDGTF